MVLCLTVLLQLGHLALKLTQLGPYPCDQLTDQSRNKEGGAEDEPRLDCHPRRANSLTRGEQHGSSEPAEDDECCAQHAKEEKRLRGKLELEPDRQHVQEADRN